MIRKLKYFFFYYFSKVDALLKFPQVKKGDTVIQCGFDAYSVVTSDLFELRNRVGATGKVIGIDPDPRNHAVYSNQILNKSFKNIALVQKATFSEKGSSEFLLGVNPSWNQLSNINIDSTVQYTGEKISVELDTIDNILLELGIKSSDISHVNLTINGAEYDALLGMTAILKEAKNLSLTIVAGRYDESGIVKGKKDYEAIIDLLQEYGFNYKFRRIHQMFWWSYIVKLFINREWVFGKQNYGVIMAVKGNKSIPWYQSFS